MRGTFTCPPFGTQPEYDLTVTQEGNDELTSYVLYLSFNKSSDSFDASVRGIVDTYNWMNQCAPYQGTEALLAYPSGQPQYTTTNYINADGDYQADFGQTLICVRKI